MNTIEALRKFKQLIEHRVDTKTGWGKVELRKEIEDCYTKILEELISPPSQIEDTK